MPPDLETYLCSYHDGFFQAPAGSIDRTREARCPNCANPAHWDDTIHHLRGITA